MVQSFLDSDIWRIHSFINTVLLLAALESSGPKCFHYDCATDRFGCLSGEMDGHH